MIHQNLQKECEVANCLYGIVDEENKEQIKTILQKRREIEKSEEVIESIEEVLDIIKKDYNKKGHVGLNLYALFCGIIALKHTKHICFE